VLVVYVGAGNGHRVAAEAIAEQVREADGCVDVTVVDALREVSAKVPLDSVVHAVYGALVTRWLRPVYAALYAVTGHGHRGVAGVLRCLFRGRATSACRRYAPDVIVSTFPYVFEVLGPTPGVSRLQVVTDAGRVHAAWAPADPGVVLVRHPLVDPDFAHDRGVGADLPVRAAATAPLDREAARAVLGIANAPTVLLSAGGPGFGTRAVKVARTVAAMNPRPQMLVVAGGNRRLLKRLQQLDWHESDRVFGWVEQPGVLLSATDVVIGKAGWLSLLEAAGAGRRTLLVDSLPGQEQQNAQVALAAGLAADARDLRDLPGLVERELATVRVAVPAVREGRLGRLVAGLAGRTSSAPTAAAREAV
jgi:processive 1,2-diacylglycerol beta-glucosyltransferase